MQKHQNKTAASDINRSTETPYRLMLISYEAAAERLRIRMTELQSELKAVRDTKNGTRNSALAQASLEKRIDLLKDEYSDVKAVMENIRFYAEKEARI